MASQKIQNNKKSSWEIECAKTEKKINEITLGIEANIVATLYAKPDLLYQYEFELSDFSSNVWKVYWAIINEIIINEKKYEIDELVIGFFLQKHTKLADKYEEYGGWNTITQATEYIKVENFESQYKELHKWNTIKFMMKQGFPVAERFSEYADLTLEEIYDIYNAKLNHIFANADCEVKSFDITDGLEEYINKLDEGVSLELPIDSMPLLDAEIGTLKKGHIFSIGASTGVGKTTMALRMVLPSIIREKKKILILLNESDQTQVQTELVIYVANNILKKDLQKKTLRNGNFTDETRALIRQCVEYINQLKDEHLITIVPLETFSIDTCVKLIQKYSSLGVEYIILDTFKMPLDNRKEASWLEMTKDAVKLYDIVKSSNRNLCLIMTYQLNKGSINRRHLNNNDVGQSKSILDVVSCNLMLRRPFDDEYEGGKNELVGFRLEGNNNKSKIPFKLNKDKNYLIFFITKNRFGDTDKYSTICEIDMSTNIVKELGICYVPEDTGTF